jgi:hypothetical protein
MVAGDWWRFADARLTRVALSATSGENVLVEIGVIAGKTSRVAAPTLPTIAPVDPRFKYIGSVIALEADSDTPTALENVENVSLVVDRAPEVRYGSNLEPRVIVPERMVNFSAGMIYDSDGQGWDFLAGASLGQVAATGDLSQDFESGSFDVEFGKHPSDATETLVVSSNGAVWDYGVERPQSDPGGGLVEFDVAGPVSEPPAGGTEVTVALENAVTLAY